jgi:SPP1 family predicted phage head-tail adaptor
MDAGSLDRRVTLYQFGTVNNVYGDLEPGYTPIATVAASVRPGPGNERLASAENAANAPTVFRVRWSSETASLNPKDQVEYDGRRFNILSVVEIGRREGLELAATARAD